MAWSFPSVRAKKRTYANSGVPCADQTAPFLVVMPEGGVERPGRKVRFARLIHRRVRAFWRTCGPRRLRRRSDPDVVATQGGTA